MFCPVSARPRQRSLPATRLPSFRTNYTFAPVCHYKIYRASAISARFFVRNRRESSDCRNWADEAGRGAGTSKEGRRGGGEAGFWTWSSGLTIDPRAAFAGRPALLSKVSGEVSPLLTSGVTEESGAVGTSPCPRHTHATSSPTIEGMEAELP